MIQSNIFHPYNNSEPLLEYIHRLSNFLHEDELRQNGKFIIEDHIDEVVDEFIKLDFYDIYRKIGIGIARLHDCVENNKSINVVSSLKNAKKNQINPNTLNLLFNPKINMHEDILYGINKITDVFSDKFEYMNNLLTISDNHYYKPLDILTINVKLCDFYSNNNNTTERYSLKNNSPEEYQKAIAFIGKKLRRSLELKFNYLPRIEALLTKNKDFRIGNDLLFNFDKSKNLISRLNDNIDEFFLLNPIMCIIKENNGLGNGFEKHLSFYENALKILRCQNEKLFNFFYFRNIQDIIDA